MKTIKDLSSTKKYRFFFHYYKRYKCISIHYRDKCITAKDVVCDVPLESKWNKSQPNLVLRGFCSKLYIENDICYIK